MNSRDYAKRLSLDIDNPPKAASFLENPIKITHLSMTPENIHEALHMDHAYMHPSDFDEIWTSPLVQSFVVRYQLNRDARSLNALLNAADEVWENKNRREKGKQYKDYASYKPSYGEIRYLEEKEVRQVSTPCPGKSGADINDSPFSVSDLGEINYKFDQPGPCKKCGSDSSCGPCGICKSCDLAIRRSQKFPQLANALG